jgi:7-carboxy-7-deazaguanine synthase
MCVRLVEVTGGEPLEQEGVYPLMDALLAKGYQVLLETNGAMDVERVPRQVVKIVDVKCPGSGVEDRNHWDNFEKLTPRQDEIKFVIKDREDYDYAKEVIRRHPLVEKFALLFSPVTEYLKPSVLAGWMTTDRLSARFQLQIHKYIWPGDAQGR